MRLNRPLVSRISLGFTRSETLRRKLKIIIINVIIVNNDNGSNWIVRTFILSEKKSCRLWSQKFYQIEENFTSLRLTTLNYLCYRQKTGFHPNIFTMWWSLYSCRHHHQWSHTSFYNNLVTFYSQEFISDITLSSIISQLSIISLIIIILHPQLCTSLRSRHSYYFEYLPDGTFPSLLLHKAA